MEGRVESQLSPKNGFGIPLQCKISFFLFFLASLLAADLSSYQPIRAKGVLGKRHPRLAAGEGGGSKASTAHADQPHKRGGARWNMLQMLAGFEEQ